MSQPPLGACVTGCCTGMTRLWQGTPRWSRRWGGVVAFCGVGGGGGGRGHHVAKRVVLFHACSCVAGVQRPRAQGALTCRQQHQCGHAHLRQRQQVTTGLAPATLTHHPPTPIPPHLDLTHPGHPPGWACAHQKGQAQAQAAQLDGAAAGPGPGSSAAAAAAGPAAAAAAGGPGAARKDGDDGPGASRAAVVDRMREDPFAAMLMARQALMNDERCDQWRRPASPPPRSWLPAGTGLASGRAGQGGEGPGPRRCLPPAAWLLLALAIRSTQPVSVHGHGPNIGMRTSHASQPAG